MKKAISILTGMILATFGFQVGAVAFDPNATSVNLSAGGGANFTGIFNASAGGVRHFSTADGNISSFGGDAYDIGNSLLVDGTPYAPTTADDSGQLVSGGVQSMGGLNVSLEYFASSTQPILRSFANFANTTGASIDTTITWQSNLGADGSTTIQNSGSGDTLFGTDDRWLVTSDIFDGDPVTAFYWYATGTPLEVTDSTFMTTTFTAAGDQGPRAEYGLSIDAGETISLLWFSSLHDTNNRIVDVANASSLMASLDTLAQGNALLDGLSPGELQRTVNWSFAGADPNTGAVPAPGTLALLGLGLTGLGYRRNRERQAVRRSYHVQPYS